MRKLTKLAALAALLLAPGAAQAVVYDATADFSVASNPNGVWTYGYSNTLGGAFNLYDSHFFPTSWNKSGEPYLGAYSGIVLHPGDNGEYSIYRFTAPSTGSYNLNVIFSDADVATTDVHVLHNNVSQFSGSITDNTSTGFSTFLALAASDIVDFAVGFGSNGNHQFDSTAVIATLTVPDVIPTGVPEPMTL